jgi:hypothetical protein
MIRRPWFCLRPLARAEWAFTSLTSTADDLLRRRTAFLVLALGASSAIGSLGNALSIVCLGLAAARGLSGRYTILILVGGRTFASIGVVGSSGLAVAANSLAACICVAIRLT